MTRDQTSYEGTHTCTKAHMHTVNVETYTRTQLKLGQVSPFPSW